jgi:transcriptional regulator with XRE-family HTH domain
MTSLRELLAFNMKEYRRTLGLSQAKLAAKANTSTQYVAMIELKRKFPTPEMLERIAVALNIDAPQLFSLPPSPAGTLRKLHETVLLEIEQAVDVATKQAVKDAVAQVIATRLNTLDEIEQ